MKTPRLSDRAALLQPSPTLAITAKAKALRAGGVDIIGLAAGEPDFDTPVPVVEAAIDALRSGFTRYTPTSGIPDLKEAAAAKFRTENGLDVEPSQIVVSCGAKQCLFNALMATISPGDEVLLFAPYWATYAEQVTLAGGRPVVVRTRLEDAFVPSLEAVRAAITPQTRAVMINSPCNPTGAVFPRETLVGIAELAAQHDLWLISDEIYERLVYDGEHLGIASLGSEVAARTITISGCSKSYAMTGWRIGFCVAPKAVASTMSNLQDQVTSNPTSFAQKGAVAALGLPPAAIDAMRDEFRSRRDRVVEWLQGIDGVQIRTPAGAFYAFADVSAFLTGSVSDDLALAEHLLVEAKVAIVPGSVFDAPGHMRLSYAASLDDLEEGVSRIASALNSLRP